MAEVLSKPKTSVEKYRLKKLIEELERKTGRGTELISLYIPPGRPISDVIASLREEHGTAANIKSKQTRKNVQDALESIMQRLKYFKKAPETGLIVFCGAIPRAGPGTEKIECYMIVPPEPVNFYLYRCNSKFYLEPLKEMIREKETYGIIVIDRNEATIALLKGKNVEIVKTLTSGIPGKHEKGGQSQRRFARIIEQLAHEFYKRVGEYANKAFLEFGENLKGVIIGGPGPTKEDFAKGDYLDYRLKRKILGLVDIGYTGEEGVFELMWKAQDIISESRYAEERRLMQKFLYLLAKNPEIVTYGINEVLQTLKHGAASLILISEEIGKAYIIAKCKSCRLKVEKIVDEKVIEREEPLKCPKCRGILEIVKAETLVDYVAEKAEKTGAKVEVLSTATVEGSQLLNVFGGLAAILRFKMNLR